jgi:hypothetical protein
MACRRCGKAASEHVKAGDGALTCPVRSTYEEAPEEKRVDRAEPGTAKGEMRYDSSR